MLSDGVLSRTFLIQAILSFAGILGLRARLYTGNVQPSIMTPVSALTPEANFDGYAPATVPAWTDLGVDPDGVPFVASETVTFPCTGSTTPNAVRGMWIEQDPVAYTDLVIGGVGDEDQVTSVATPFVEADAGKTLVITGGTGFTPGTYTILAVDGGNVATLSVPAGTAASTGGTGSLDATYPDLACKFASLANVNLPGDGVSFTVKVRADGRVGVQVVSDL